VSARRRAARAPKEIGPDAAVALRVARRRLVGVEPAGGASRRTANTNANPRTGRRWRSDAPAVLRLPERPTPRARAGPQDPRVLATSREDDLTHQVSGNR